MNKAKRRARATAKAKSLRNGTYRPRKHKRLKSLTPWRKPKETANADQNTAGSVAASNSDQSTV